jgi:hypothetical protein
MLICDTFDKQPPPLPDGHLSEIAGPLAFASPPGLMNQPPKSVVIPISHSFSMLPSSGSFGAAALQSSSPAVTANSQDRVDRSTVIAAPAVASSVAPATPQTLSTPAHGGADNLAPEAAASADPSVADVTSSRPVLTGADSVLVVQYQLPVRLWYVDPPGVSDSFKPGSRIWHAEWDEEALLSPKRAAVVHSTQQLGSVRFKWIGTPPIEVEPVYEEAVTRVLEPLRCIPVFLPPATHRAFYDGYCRDTLWPVFHNVIDVYGEVPSRWWNGEQQHSRWKVSARVNAFHEICACPNII